jgi:hypothetical protein
LDESKPLTGSLSTAYFKLIAMSKSNLQISLVSNRSALVIFGITILLTGIHYFYYAKQISMLLPGFLPKSDFWVYLIGTAFLLSGLAIIINKQITTLASFLLALLLICLAVGIDLRGIFNKDDDMKFLFSQSLLKDVGLAAGAIIIANFQRDKPSRRHHRYSGTKSENKPQP